MPRSFAILITMAVVLWLASEPIGATALQVGSGTLGRAGDAVSVKASVSWDNAWRTERNHDAVWLFVKVRSNVRGPWRHARIQSASADSGQLSCAPSADNVGAFCAAALAHRGRLASAVTLTLDLGPAGGRGGASPSLEARVFGIEMVHIPSGPFSIGDPDPRSVEFAAYYRSDAAGNHGGMFRIESEAAVRVAPEAGALYYRARTPQYQGDRSGPIPEEFPKGTRAFYAMKYEVLQGQYAAFLNTIGAEAAAFRAIHGGIGYYAERGTIRLDGNVFVADAPDRPANWISWDDGLAFADWSGLRPMTEFEFTKAARGPEDPGPAQYPWGTPTRDRLVRRMGADRDLARTGPADESLLGDATRDLFGASYYWVMDLAGSVWERVVTAGHPRGRAFRGSHGDGQLASYGMATNGDWPAGDHEVGGYGYRGGGHYELGQPESEFNPYSPVEWRPFGSWGGAPRSVAYGFRAARTGDR